MTKNKELATRAGSSIKTGTMPPDVADLLEYALNEVEPKIKTKRGTGSTIETKIGGRKLVITVSKPKRGRQKEYSPALNLAEIKELTEMMDRHGMEFMQFENDDFKLFITKDKNGFPFVIEGEPA